MNVGETRDVRLTWPEDHPALAGQTIDYTVTLKALKEKVVPAADDEFAKDLDFESLAGPARRASASASWPPRSGRSTAR